MKIPEITYFQCIIILGALQGAKKNAFLSGLGGKQLDDLITIFFDIVADDKNKEATDAGK